MTNKKEVSTHKEDSPNLKTCFIVMPISDMDGYKAGHFTRVYEYIIKRACAKAGYRPIRADEEGSSNLIVMDILKKVVESDMVICDLSGRNANVFYELGIRQAFNKPTVLIKDKKTPRIFDTSSLRDIEYDEMLRVDNVENDIENISKTITQTALAKGKDVNSLIQLLSIQPAKVPESVHLSDEDSLIMRAITNLSSEVRSLQTNNRTIPRVKATPVKDLNVRIDDSNYLINEFQTELGDTMYLGDKEIGTLEQVNSHSILIKEPNGELVEFNIGFNDYGKINCLGF